MSRYANNPDRLMCVRVLRGNKPDRHKQDTFKNGNSSNAGNGLDGGGAAPGAAMAAPQCRVQRHPGAAPWFAQGPIYLAQAKLVAGLGGYAVLVWLAVRASADGRDGRLADAAWIAEATGLCSRTVRDVVAKLASASLLRRTRHGLEPVELPKPSKRKRGRHSSGPERSPGQIPVIARPKDTREVK